MKESNRLVAITCLLMLIYPTIGIGSLFEYWYRGDEENCYSRFNDNLSNEAFEGSLFLEISGGTSVTLADNSVLILAIDGAMGKIKYLNITPESAEGVDMYAFGEGPGDGEWTFGGISDISADKWGNIAVSEELNDRIHLFKYIDGEVFYVDNPNPAISL